MAYFTFNTTQKIGASIKYITKEEQTANGILIYEKNCSMFSLEDLLIRDEEIYRSKERNLNRVYLGDTTSHFEKIKNNSQKQGIIDSKAVYGYAGYVSFSSQDDLSLKDARDVTRKTLDKVFGEKGRYVVAAHIQGRNIHAHFVSGNGRNCREAGITKPSEFAFYKSFKYHLNETCKEAGLSSMYESIMYKRNRPKMSKKDLMARKIRNPKEHHFTLRDRVENKLKESIYSLRHKTLLSLQKELDKDGYQIKDESIRPPFGQRFVELKDTMFISWQNIQKELKRLWKLNKERLERAFNKNKDFNIEKVSRDEPKLLYYLEDSIERTQARRLFQSKGSVSIAMAESEAQVQAFINDSLNREMQLQLMMGPELANRLMYAKMSNVRNVFQKLREEHLLDLSLLDREDPIEKTITKAIEERETAKRINEEIRDEAFDEFERELALEKDIEDSLEDSSRFKDFDKAYEDIDRKIDEDLEKEEIENTENSIAVTFGRDL